jgi:uncharacterized OsmC-like protein
MMETNAATPLTHTSPQPARGMRQSGPVTEGILTLNRHADGRLDVGPGATPPDARDHFGLRPVEHLAMALGGCLSEFAGRFLERRELPSTLQIDVHWKVSVQQCAIDAMHVTLRIDTDLDDMARETLHRMLDLCPVHKALQGNVPVGLEVVEG